LTPFQFPVPISKWSQKFENGLKRKVVDLSKMNNFGVLSF
jgi:hypothetical protein